MRLPKKIKFQNIFFGELYLFSVSGESDTPEDVNKLAKRVQKVGISMTEDEAWAFLNETAQASMAVIANGTGHSIFWGVNEDALPQYQYNELIGIIAHESNHVMAAIQNAIYGENETFDEETQSYLIQRIAEAVTPHIFRWCQTDGE